MMFWRLLWQLFRASRGRLAVALVALVSGAAVSSALINLHLGAERKLTEEFRTLGANIVVAPPRADSSSEPPLMDAAVLETIGGARAPEVVAAAPYLYVVGRVNERQSVIVAGTWFDEVRPMAAWWSIEGEWIGSRDDRGRAMVGRNVARQLGLQPGGQFELAHGSRSERLAVAAVVATGGPEDNQVFVSLAVAQQLAGLPGRIGLVQMSVRGAPAQVAAYAGRLAAWLPQLEVRPIRQIAEAEGQLLGRIRGLLLATLVLILTLTALCVLATMAALAMERRRDVGLMKALGGSMPRVVRLFLTEAGLLGAFGGAVGYVGGIFLSAWMGRSIFGASIAPRAEVLPLTIALMTAVALAGAFPLRLLGRIRPAEILRGE